MNEVTPIRAGVVPAENSGATIDGETELSFKCPSHVLSQLDQAAHLTRIVASSISESLVDDVDYRAAVMGIAHLIQGIYNELAETREG